MDKMNCSGPIKNFVLTISSSYVKYVKMFINAAWYSECVRLKRHFVLSMFVLSVFDCIIYYILDIHLYNYYTKYK